MNDTIPNGSGNSRTLASVPNFLTLYPTYEAFAQALMNRELPIDIGPLNPAGVQQMGTPYDKANVLTDETAALYGKGSNASPCDDHLLRTFGFAEHNPQSAASPLPAPFKRGLYERSNPMTIIKIEQNANGSHDNQTIDGYTPETFPVPEGWAVVPEELGTPGTLEHYPFGEVTVGFVDEAPTVMSWKPLPIPEPEPEPDPGYTDSDMIGALIGG